MITDLYLIFVGATPLQQFLLAGLAIGLPTLLYFAIREARR